MRNILFSIMLFAIMNCYSKNEARNYSDYPIQNVKMNQVKLVDSFWLPRIQLIQNTVIAHAFEKCHSEGRIENFQTAHRVMNGDKGKIRGTMPFDDTDVYKILEGVAYSLINNPNHELEAYSDSIISIIAMGQEPDGYLTTWRTIDPLHPTSEWVPGGPRWSHLEISHELYNSGHLFEAASAYHWATGKNNLLNIALKNADLLVEVFGDSTFNAVPGHQIVETGLIKLYHITGNEDYLKLSKKFLDLRGDATVRQIWGATNIQDHKPILQQDEAVGHAVRAVYMYAGMTDIAVLYNDSDYLKAVNTLWDNMTDKKMYITGGIGSRHHLEEFGDNYELPNLTAYSETCAAIGSIYWNERMFRMTGDAKYYDLIERTLYNGVIAGISLDGTHFFYPNPLESDGQFAFNKGSCTREEWFDCSCCPTNLIRFIPYVPNLIYATRGRDLYVNMFMGNEADLKLDNNNVNIIQSTNYPMDGKVTIQVSPTIPEEFNLKIRIPGWAKSEITSSELYQYANNKTNNYIVAINDEIITPNVNEGYIIINRKWNKEDKIELDFPMQVHQIIADTRIENLQNQMALEYGPFVYCAEKIDNPTNFNNIQLSKELDYNVIRKPDMLRDINLIEVVDKNKSYIFIPYYTWSNRGVNSMQVWFPEI